MPTICHSKQQLGNQQSPPFPIPPPRQPCLTQHLSRSLCLRLSVLSYNQPTYAAFHILQLSIRLTLTQTLAYH